MVIDYRLLVIEAGFIVLIPTFTNQHLITNINDYKFINE